MTRMQLIVSDDLYYDVRMLAAMRKVSISAIARKGMRDQVKKARSKKIPAGIAMLEMAKHAYKGKVPKDFSTNDDYLYKLP